MAALAASAVSLYPTGLGEAEFYPNGKGDQTLITRRLKIDLTGQGGATNTIGAAALGFNKLICCSDMNDVSGTKVYPAAVDPTTNVIHIADVSSSNAYGDVSGTSVYLTVTGTPKVLAV
jgi:hypothetical protein